MVEHRNVIPATAQIDHEDLVDIGHTGLTIMDYGGIGRREEAGEATAGRGHGDTKKREERRIRTTPHTEERRGASDSR